MIMFNFGFCKTLDAVGIEYEKTTVAGKREVREDADV